MRLAVLVSLLVLAGCGSSPSSSESGIRGQAQVGICAAEQQGMDCSVPFRGEFQVRQDGRVVETVRTGKNGRFEVALSPGRYVLAADAGPLLKPVQVVVPANAFTTVTLFFDSGIR
jgi:hypothetical protein